jgi:hypothetical protein
MRKDRDVDAVLRKCASELGQAEPNRLFPASPPQARLNFGLLDPLDGRFYPIDRAARNRPERSAAGGDGRASPKSHRRKPAPSTPRPADENAADANLSGAHHSGCSGLTNRFRALGRGGREASRRGSPAILSALLLTADLSLVENCACELSSAIVHLGAAPELLSPAAALKSKLPDALIMRSEGGRD